MRSRIQLGAWVLKISIDSATLMNKGLERIEAKHLFDIDLDDICVVIQRQSKIHSMVEYRDGSVMAHLGASDMRIPIQYALSYPERWESPAERIDFRELGRLDFASPDVDGLPLLGARCARRQGRGHHALRIECCQRGGLVDASLHGACSFMDIARVVERCLDAHDVYPVQSIEQLRDVDSWTRTRASDLVSDLMP